MFIMIEKVIVFVSALAMSGLTILGDFFIKQAAVDNNADSWKKVVIGGFIWFITAIGWFFLLKKEKLISLGGIYLVSSVILLVFVSVFIFKEKVSEMEIVGIIMAIISLIILARFS